MKLKLLVISLILLINVGFAFTLLLSTFYQSEVSISKFHLLAGGMGWWWGTTTYMIVDNYKYFISIFIFLITIYLFLISNVIAKQQNYLNKGIELFQKKEFDKSKILFEKDIVFDPKSEKSYLYLAKIFNKNNDDEQQEINLNNVLLLNPGNDEAIYMLTLLKIKQSDYSHARELIDKFILICKSFCSKENEIREKLEILTPENAKDNNWKNFKKKE